MLNLFDVSNILTHALEVLAETLSPHVVYKSAKSQLHPPYRLEQNSIYNRHVIPMSLANQWWISMEEIQ